MELLKFEVIFRGERDDSTNAPNEQRAGPAKQGPELLASVFALLYQCISCIPRVIFAGFCHSVPSYVSTIRIDRPNGLPLSRRVFQRSAAVAGWATWVTRLRWLRQADGLLRARTLRRPWLSGRRSLQRNQSYLVLEDRNTALRRHRIR